MRRPWIPALFSYHSLSTNSLGLKCEVLRADCARHRMLLLDLIGSQDGFKPYLKIWIGKKKIFLNPMQMLNQWSQMFLTFAAWRATVFLYLGTVEIIVCDKTKRLYTESTKKRQTTQSCAEFFSRQASSDRISRPLFDSASCSSEFICILSLCVPRQEQPDFRDPLMVSLDFGLAEEDQGPVLDESLPRSISQTVRLHLLTTHRYSLDTFYIRLRRLLKSRDKGSGSLLHRALALVCNSWEQFLLKACPCVSTLSRFPRSHTHALLLPAKSFLTDLLRWLMPPVRESSTLF